MTDIQSKEVIDKISEELKIQPAIKIPRELMDKIQLVYNVNPNFSNTTRFASNTSVVTGATTIFTTSPTKRTFLTGVYFHYQHDAAANSTSLSLTAVPILRNDTTSIILFRKITLTATQDRIYVPFPVPMELALNSSIIMNQTFTLGVGVMSGGITFFEVDPQ